MRGAGSLAHEYGHALDFILGGILYGKSLSDACKRARLGLQDPLLVAMADVVRVMKWKGGVQTEFYKNSQRVDTLHSKDSQGYWQSDLELFARAFACYVKDKLEVKGIRNDYLCGHADTCVTFDENLNVIKAYPEGAERIAINAKIDALMEQIKQAFLFEVDTEVAS